MLLACCILLFFSFSVASTKRKGIVVANFPKNFIPQSLPLGSMDLRLIKPASLDEMIDRTESMPCVSKAQIKSALVHSTMQLLSKIMRICAMFVLVSSLGITEATPREIVGRVFFLASFVDIFISLYFHLKRRHGRSIDTSAEMQKSLLKIIRGPTVYYALFLGHPKMFSPNSMLFVIITSIIFDILVDKLHALDSLENKTTTL